MSQFLLRNGVTGNTSGFELEGEGSIPSPAAISAQLRYFDSFTSEVTLFRPATVTRGNRIVVERERWIEQRIHLEILLS